MYIDLSVIYYFAYAAAIGIAFAIIYTNIQRSAYYRFVSALNVEDAFSQDKAKTLLELDLKRIDKLVIKSSIKNKHGLGKVISCVTSGKSNDKLEAVLANYSDDDKYYISSEDHDAVKAKYEYSPLSLKQILGYIIGLAIAMVVFTFGVKMFYDEHMAPKLEKSTGIEETSENQTQNDEGDDYTEVDDDASDSTPSTGLTPGSGTIPTIRD